MGVGGLLVSAGLLKWRQGLERFAAAVLRYEIVRGRAARALAGTVPIAEIGLGTLLLLGVFTRSAALGAALLVAAFTVAVGISFVRGRRDSCGCGGALEGRIGPRLIARNVGLLVALLAVSLGSST